VNLGHEQQLPGGRAGAHSADTDGLARLAADAGKIIARYPQPRSALLPLLHLVQSEQGCVSAAGIEFCAGRLGLTPAEVQAVATFHTMYKRRPVGEYYVGVCTTTLCAITGGDAIFAALSRHLGIGDGETTGDGKITLEHIACNAACDYAPVVVIGWEFFDNMTPGHACRLVDDLRAGTPVWPTRGSGPLCTFKQTQRILAGFWDTQPSADTSEGYGGEPTLAGLRLARRRGWHAPDPAGAHVSADGDGGT